MSQDVHLFNDTVRANIAYADPSASEEAAVVTRSLGRDGHIFHAELVAVVVRRRAAQREQQHRGDACLCRSDAGGDARLIISMQAKMAVMLDGLMPEISAQGRALMNRLLPGVSLLQDKESFTGCESGSKWAPSKLTKLSDEAAVENNEVGKIEVSTCE